MHGLQITKFRLRAASWNICPRRSPFRCRNSCGYILVLVMTIAGNLVTARGACNIGHILPLFAIASSAPAPAAP